MTEKLLEKLAELDHKQWMKWSKNTAKNYKLPKPLIDKWKVNWIPYSKLSEEQKNNDRKWARKAIMIIKGCNK